MEEQQWIRPLVQLFFEEQSNLELTDNLIVQVLDHVATRLQREPEYRSELGNQPPFWRILSHTFESASSSGLQPSRIQPLIRLFRILRNLVANNSINQSRSKIVHLHEPLHEILSQAVATHYGNQEFIQLIRVGVQTLANLMTANRDCQKEIWDFCLVQVCKEGNKRLNSDRELLCHLAAMEDEIVIMTVSVLVFNTVAGGGGSGSGSGGSDVVKDDEEEATGTVPMNEFTKLLMETKSGQGLILQLVRNSHHLASLEQDRQSFHMIYRILDSLIDQGLFQQMFMYLGEAVSAEATKAASAEDDDENDGKITEIVEREPHQLCTEQVTLLKILDSKLFTVHQKQQQDEQPSQQLGLGTVKFLATLYGHISQGTIEILKQLSKMTPSALAVEDLANLSSSLVLLLGCFAHLSLYEDEISAAVVEENSSEDGQEKVLEWKASVPNWFRKQHKVMVEGQVVENSIALLAQADQSLARITKPTTPATPATTTTTTTTTTEPIGANSNSTLLSNTSTAQGQQEFFVGIKRDLVRVIGNLSYRSRDVQDRVRAAEGLVVMLSQCNIDDANPFLREYAILAMKNLMQGNLENQALIEELKPIEAVDHPVLQEAKISSRLDENGKPILQRKKD